MNKKIQILSILFLGVSQFVFSQIKEEKLILDRKREPEIKKIEKKKTSVVQEKNYPPKEKKTQDSLNLKYTITDVPASSDFKTSTIKSEDISPKFSTDFQKNYFQIGYGNYGKFLADGNLSYEIQKNTEIGTDVHVLSTQGLKDLYNWNTKQQSINLGAFLNNYSEKGKTNVSVDFGMNDYNYYGIYALQPSFSSDLTQKYNQFKINGYYDLYSNEILNDVRVKTSFLTDHFDAKESDGTILLNLAKDGFSFPNDVKMNAELETKLQVLNTQFAILDKNSSNHLLVSFVPKLKFYHEKSYLTLGSNFSFVNSKMKDELNPEEKENYFSWSPFVEILYYSSDKFRLYAGVDGGVKLNSYTDLLQENPYLVSDQKLKPTDTKYHFYFGLKGDINQNIKYDINAGFSKLENALFYKGNNIFDDIVTTNRSAYNFANTFSVIYENGTLNEIKGSLQYFPLENLVIDGELKFQQYHLENRREVYYKPLIQTTLGVKYLMLSKKLNFEFKGIFVTDRTSNFYEINNNGINSNAYISTENTKTKVGGFADLNLSVDYKINKNFSIFALGNNLLNTKYQTFNSYKVLGVQILGGVRISF